MTSPFPYNYHSHSKYCDGAHQLEDYIIACIDKGYQSYGFSSHAPIPGGSVWNMKAEMLEGYLKEVDRLKEKYNSRIEIFKSLEVDFIDEVQGPSSYAHLLDYTVGSIHFIGKGPISELFEMDGPYSKFLDGLAKHYDNNLRAAMEHYFELSTKMILNDAPDVIGHPDKIISHALKNDPTILSKKWYGDLLEDFANTLEQSDVIVEINTKGLKLSQQPTTYPHLSFLNILKNKNIKFQMNADVHKLSDIDLGYQNTLELIRRLGIKELWIRENEEWKAKSI
ncbi:MULTISPECIES: histidinol-phosphatase [unclassified Lentimicrobium]|uniref:histidinol-phosphatase n=1 Tax=unclassified Lentimicrobium TaxID=2677434 RepID=UPI001552E867|nr:MULTISPECIES: histidinol-phosphatase [unclassified Lentimicrobium]NPD44714.1 histidinol-phosphatase [Lentimicrobium sp. S6]NPD83430.1 histidinol-phosphatase [Lentimicrobium sp. L6]